jgi:hypothetical protein
MKLAHGQPKRVLRPRQSEQSRQNHRRPATTDHLLTKKRSIFLAISNTRYTWAVETGGQENTEPGGSYCVHPQVHQDKQVSFGTDNHNPVRSIFCPCPLNLGSVNFLVVPS